MASVGEILNFLTKIAPVEFAEGFDNVGLIVGDEDINVSKAIVALDITTDVINEAINHNAQLIISHHPVVFGNMSTVSPQNYISKRAYNLVRNGLAAICMHTNLDAADDGVGETLAKKIGLEDIRELNGSGTNANMGRIGFLNEAVEPEWLALNVKDALGCETIKYVAGDKKVSSVAVLGGSGADYISLAISEGADAFVTSEVKLHNFIFAKENGFTLIDAGHYETEYPIIPSVKERLEDEFPSVKFILSNTGNIIKSLY